jgi:uncharacterized membrane protein YhaH (DUF805 family)
VAIVLNKYHPLRVKWKNAFSAYWRRYADSNGQTSRPDFLRATAAVWLIGFAFVVLAGFVETAGPAIFFLWVISTLVPSLAILTRRLRDANYSRLWLLLLLLGPLGLVGLLALASRTRKAGLLLRARDAAKRAEPVRVPRAPASESQVGGKEKTPKKRLTRDERKERNQKIKERKAAAENAHREKYGKPIASGAFGWTFVEVYKSGHVRVSRGAMQQLLGIEFTDLSQRKNQIGRVVGFLGTGGLNMATSTRKGEAYLSITTPSGVRTVKTSEARPSDIETAQKLVAAAKAISASVQHSSAGSSSNVEDISAQLEKLSALKEQGALSKEEFSAAKKKLLG